MHTHNKYTQSSKPLTFTVGCKWEKVVQFDNKKITTLQTQKLTVFKLIFFDSTLIYIDITVFMYIMQEVCIIVKK